MSHLDRRWYVCVTGKMCCVERCVLFIDAPVDIRNFKRCPQEGRAIWRGMTDSEIKKMQEAE